MLKGFNLRNLHWLWLTLFIVLLDQGTKYLMVQHFYYGEVKALLPFLNLILIYNPGAAFNFLSDASGWQRWFLIGVSVIMSVVILLWLCRLKAHERWMALGLSLVLGGAIGNGIDRIVHGYVIDFIHLYYQTWSFPDFNVADSAITIGAVCLIIGMLFPKKT